MRKTRKKPIIGVRSARFKREGTQVDSGLKQQRLTTCNLVSVWNSGWNEGDKAELIHHYYQDKKHSNTKEISVSLAEFAAKETEKEMLKLIQNRIKYLDRELSGKK